MNRFDEFFAAMDPDEWENFAADFLFCLGYIIILPPGRGVDGGKDLIVEKDAVKYLVSCKNTTQSGKYIGAIDTNFFSRMIQHKCNGFIAFYSVGATADLTNMIYGFKDHPDFNHYHFLIFDKMHISNYLPFIPTNILQKYGPYNKFTHPIHVSEIEYQPLNCMECGKDILKDTNNIMSSMATILQSDDGLLHYAYGCFTCLNNYSYYQRYGYVSLNQVLHHEQFVGWNSWLKDILDLGIEPDAEFYKHKNDFDTKIQQRIFPSGWGTWLGSNFL